MALLGVFGGTFDPIHYGHLRCAWEVSMRLDCPVHMIPAARPVHRQQPGANSAQRLDMLERALDGQQRLVADDREIRRSGPSYMFDTLQSLADDHADDTLCLIVGSDAFAGLDRWYRWKALFEVAHLVVMTRPGPQQDPSPELQQFIADREVGQVAQLRRQNHGLMLRVPVTSLHISASKIRRYLANGDPPRYLVPDPVLDYIIDQELYGGGSR